MLTVARDPNVEVQAIQIWRYKRSKFAVKPYAHSSHFGFIGVEGEHSTYIIRLEALCSQQPFRVNWGVVGKLLLTSSALRPYAHSSHSGFIGGEHSTYIIRFEAFCSLKPFRVYWGGTFYLHHPLWGLLLTAAIEGLLGGNILLTSSVLKPSAHSSHLGFIGVGGEHSTYIIRCEALCSQQPFRVNWGVVGKLLLTSSALRPFAHSSHLGFIGVGGGNILLTYSAVRPYAHNSHLGFIGGAGNFYLHHPLWGLLLTAAI